MANLNPRKINVESGAGTLRLYEDMPLKPQMPYYTQSFKTETKDVGSEQIINFEEFKSNLERKMESF